MTKKKTTRTSKRDDPLERMREICLALPGAHETITWGEPHFRVGDKIFAGCGGEKGVVALGFKLEKEHARALIARDPRYRPAPYVGKHGWVSVDAHDVDDWEAVRAFVEESFRLIAPKRASKALAKRTSPPANARGRARKPSR